LRLWQHKFDDSLGWNLDLLLRLWIKTRARFPLLLHQLAETGQDKFAILFEHTQKQKTGAKTRGEGGPSGGKISARQRNISSTRVLSFRLFVLSVLVGRLAEDTAKLAAEMALIEKAGIGGHFSERTL
jgi:hypothetical protein